MTTIPGLDLSHWQGAPDFGRIAAAGHKFVYCKATQGLNFVDQQFARNRIEAKRNGLVFGAYHFPDGADVTAEARHFAAVVGTLQVGEFVVLDQERPALPASWSKTWLDLVTGFWGTKPLLYLNDSQRTGQSWAQVVAGDYGYIRAHYDNVQDFGGVAPWPFAAIKQFWDKGSVPGVSGLVDLDVFNGDVATLLRYCRQGAPAPAPVPVPTPPPAPVPPSPEPGHFDVRSWRVSFGQSDAHLPSLQAWANRMFPAYHCTPIGPLATNYGPQTRAFVKELGGHVGVPNDGNDIGPRIAAALYQLGWRG
jgi:GH25 family lysozyme M1 (1,4-beta-N-acetylmuramidase)